MSKVYKRFISVILSLALILTLSLPMTVFANDPPPPHEVLGLSMGEFIAGGHIFAAEIEPNVFAPFNFFQMSAGFTSNQYLPEEFRSLDLYTHIADGMFWSMGLGAVVTPQAVTEGLITHINGVPAFPSHSQESYILDFLSELQWPVGLSSDDAASYLSGAVVSGLANLATPVQVNEIDVFVNPPTPSALGSILIRFADFQNIWSAIQPAGVGVPADREILLHVVPPGDIIINIPSGLTVDEAIAYIGDEIPTMEVFTSRVQIDPERVILWVVEDVDSFNPYPGETNTFRWSVNIGAVVIHDDYLDLASLSARGVDAYVYPDNTTLTGTLRVANEDDTSGSSITTGGGTFTTFYVGTAFAVADVETETETEEAEEAEETETFNETDADTEDAITATPGDVVPGSVSN